MSQKPRCLTGIQTSGTVHVGNYLGMIKPALGWQKTHDCIFFLVDLHSLTSQKNPEELRRSTHEIIATWLACGLDLKSSLLCRQSDVAHVTEFTWYLTCVTSMGLLEKGHAYKDAVANGKEINHGVFAYPVLMAADILMYDADLVPVGKDQKQHVEFARDIAGSFNAVYGEGVLKLPEVSIEEKVMTIPGLDGRKMSKSYNNTIPLWDDFDVLRKKVLSIKTDSSALEAPKSLEGHLVGELFSHFATPEEYADLERRLNAGGLGWGHAKDELALAMDRYLSPIRARYKEFYADRDYLTQVITEGAERAKAISIPVLQRVRRAVGID